jgi:hypothetical protein
VVHIFQIEYGENIFLLLSLWVYRVTTAPDHTQSHTHTFTHTRYYSSGRGIGPSQRLYLTTHNIHKRETSTLPTKFETTLAASELSQICALDRAATDVGERVFLPTLTIYTQARIRAFWAWRTEFLLGLCYALEFKIITLFITNNFIIQCNKYLRIKYILCYCSRFMTCRICQYRI